MHKLFFRDFSNPVSQFLEIITKIENSHFQFIDLEGKTLIDFNEKQIDVSILTPGLYQLIKVK